MDKITACAMAFQKLCDCEYDILLGRKGVSEHIRLVFRPYDFHHLAGLHKLSDAYELRRLKRSYIWDAALGGTLTDSQLMKSAFFWQIDSRIDALTRLESMLDSDGLYFRYNENIVASKISAKYLIEIEDSTSLTYLFLDRIEDDLFFCRSIFPKGNIDYAGRQTKLTLLRKEKKLLSRNTSTLLYERGGLQKASAAGHW